MSTPRIVCIALVGKRNSPLLLLTFPGSGRRDNLGFHFLVHATLDVFKSRLPSKTNGDSDFGLLYAVDEELALYGWLTNTGIKIVVAVESPTTGDSDLGTASGGIREGDLKPVFRALQTVYISLVCNPFYENDEKKPIGSKKFLNDVRRIAETWKPGVTP